MAVQGVLVSLCEFTKEEPEDANETDMCGFVWKSEEPIRFLAAMLGGIVIFNATPPESSRMYNALPDAMMPFGGKA
jgi:hypothetical protein